MNNERFLPPLSMGMRSSTNITSELLAALIEKPALHALLDSFAEAIIVFDSDARVRFVNLAAERINRVARQDAAGWSEHEFYSRSALSFEEFQAVQERGGRSALTRSPDGRVLITSVQVVPVGVYEQPFRVLQQRDIDAREGHTRGQPKPAREQLPDPQRHTLHMSPLLAMIADTGVRAFRRNARLLLLGESGVGKTAVARHIHHAAGWGDRPFVHVNCGSIPETLFESEMFGYERGAFTGALQGGKRGYIEAASGGTLFLDEVGEIPLQVQAKLLKFLEDSTIQLVGSPLSKTIKVQIIAATNKDLRHQVEQGLFRADLYYRLAVLPVQIPPLRDHLEDLPVLMDVLLTRINLDREPPMRLSSGCRTRLLNYTYPGNIRELVNLFERLAVLADDEAMERHLPADLGRAPSAPSAMSDEQSLKAQVQQFERRIILEAVDACGSKRKAAVRLGIDIGTLIRKLQRD